MKIITDIFLRITIIYQLQIYHTTPLSFFYFLLFYFILFYFILIVRFRREVSVHTVLQKLSSNTDHKTTQA
jgi:hypothetical protein